MLNEEHNTRRTSDEKNVKFCTSRWYINSVSVFDAEFLRIFFVCFSLNSVLNFECSLYFAMNSAPLKVSGVEWSMLYYHAIITMLKFKTINSFISLVMMCMHYMHCTGISTDNSSVHNECSNSTYLLFEQWYVYQFHMKFTYKCN